MSSLSSVARLRVQTLLLCACPLPGPISGLTAWTMTRVRAVQGFHPLQLGLGVLLAMMVLMSAWLGRTLLVWGRHVRGIEGALRKAGAVGTPTLDRTGERELDQIIDALNEAGLRVAEARQEADRMAGQAARAERLAGLGRVAAGVAHEIRNPLAAARLQGENALAEDDARRREAIGDMLGQIDRLDGLVEELLAMTQRVEPKTVCVDLMALLTDQVTRHKETNAIRHAPTGGAVVLSADCRPDLLILTVEDSGDGVPPEMAERLFEPFVTGRPESTGLGLAIARELTDAHGGRLVLSAQRRHHIERRRVRRRTAPGRR